MRSLYPFLLGLIVGAGGVFFLKITRPLYRRSGNGDPKDHYLSSGPYLVAVGGGTGLSSFLMGLKSFTRNITAVVTVSDEGGSSGRITRDWGVLPPGDIRNCIVALSENDDALKAFMDFRFDKGDLAGHSLGNLMLLAATEVYGDFEIAVKSVNQLLAMKGQVLPVTAETVVLVGETKDGKTARGELEVSSKGAFLNDIWLEPQGAKPVAGAMSALDTADAVVLGPGSLFTSIIPNLLIKDFSHKLSKLKTPLIYITNLMTQPQETTGMSITDHVNWIERICGRLPDYLVVNEQEIPQPLLGRYNEDGAVPLYMDAFEESKLAKRGCRVVRGPYVRVAQSADGSSVVRHDGRRVAETVLSLLNSSMEP